MTDEVKLYAYELSPYVFRVKIALNMKGIKYENIEEDISNKSSDLLNYNPVLKQVPVLVHNGNPICESLVIIEYIDDVWKGVPILPKDPYEKSVARFWAKFMDDKCAPAVINVFLSKGEQQALVEVCDQLQVVENELRVRGTKFFGGDNINLVDIAAGLLAFWVGTLEEATGVKLMMQDKFPKLVKWADNFINCTFVKEILPPREDLLEYHKTWNAKGLSS